MNGDKDEPSLAGGRAEERRKQFEESRGIEHRSELELAHESSEEPPDGEGSGEEAAP